MDGETLMRKMRLAQHAYNDLDATVHPKSVWLSTDKKT